MIIIDTKKCCEIIDITAQVNDAVSASGIKSGVCTISSRHTTTAILVNEAEQGLIDDIPSMMSGIVPDDGYSHDLIDDNTHAHLKAMLLGPSKTMPVREGKLMLGTWQSILFVEFDGPRTRTVDVSVMRGK